MLQYPHTAHRTGSFSPQTGQQVNPTIFLLLGATYSKIEPAMDNGARVEVMDNWARVEVLVG